MGKLQFLGARDKNRKQDRPIQYYGGARPGLSPRRLVASRMVVNSTGEDTVNLQKVSQIHSIDPAEILIDPAEIDRAVRKAERPQHNGILQPPGSRAISRYIKIPVADPFHVVNPDPRTARSLHKTCQNGDMCKGPGCRIGKGQTRR